MPLRPIPRPKVQRLGRTPGKFTQSRRLDYLQAQLESHAQGLTLEDMATLLHVSTRSVRRYLRELARVTELESVEIRPGSQHLWRIKPSERGRTVALRRTQAYALLATRRVFDVLRGSALFDEIDLALRQVEKVANRAIVRAGEAPADARLEARFAYVPSPTQMHPGRGEDVDEAFQAMADLRVLRFRYLEDGGAHGAGGARRTRIVSHPYAVVMHAGAITCIARDADRDEVRTFAFERMSEIQASHDERFKLPPDFDLAEWVHGDFGISHAPRTVNLLVEFDARAAEAVRSRRVHPSQKLLLAADGRVRTWLSLPEAPEVLARVKRWVLGFGAAARIVEPRELAAELANELHRAAARYAQ